MLFKSKAPEKDKNAAANAAEVMGGWCSSNTRLLNRSRRPRWYQNVWPGRAVQDGLPRSANVRAASMYQASEVEQFAPGHHGFRAHPRLTSGKTSKAILAPSLLVAPGRPFVHLFIPSRRPRRASYRY